MDEMRNKETNQEKVQESSWCEVTAKVEKMVMMIAATALTTMAAEAKAMAKYQNKGAEDCGGESSLKELARAGWRQRRHGDTQTWHLNTRNGTVVRRIQGDLDNKMERNLNK